MGVFRNFLLDLLAIRPASTLQDAWNAMQEGGELRGEENMDMSPSDLPRGVEMEVAKRFANEQVSIRYFRSRNPEGVRESYDILIFDKPGSIEVFFTDGEVDRWSRGRIRQHAMDGARRYQALQILQKVQQCAEVA